MRLSHLVRWPRGAGWAALVGALILVACQERLAGPADCPNLCPGGYQLRDTVIDPIPHADSSFLGYLKPGQGNSLRVSWQFPVSDDRTVVRFIVRPDSWVVTTDSFLPYTIDSVALSVTVAYRDTTVKNLYVYLYRLPATLDSNYTFTDADAAFSPSSIIDSLKMDDTLVTQTLRAVLSGPDLARVAIAQPDTGILAMGVQIRAAQGTGVRLGNSGSAAPLFQSYINVIGLDTTTSHKSISRGPGFQRFLSAVTPTLDTTLLTVGGAPSARSIIRFPWPEYLKDSAQLVRVSLELVPSAPIPGLRGDTAFIQARPVLADFGSKSPTTSTTTYIATTPVLLNQTDTVRLEVRPATTLWQGTQPLPSAFMLQLFPEAASFTTATFGSSRTPGFAPRLRVTYALKFPFEAP
ncbi:MAG TPA: hypothetical protein VEI47_10225 [Gemmatimonadales bacterium]|nr:hypothetical protein [Gemmatimonadales bacterium]